MIPGWRGWGIQWGLSSECCLICSLLKSLVFWLWIGSCYINIINFFVMSVSKICPIHCLPFNYMVSSEPPENLASTQSVLIFAFVLRKFFPMGNLVNICLLTSCSSQWFQLFSFCTALPSSPHLRAPHSLPLSSPSCIHFSQ